MKYKWSIILALLSLLFSFGTVLAKGSQLSPRSLNNAPLQTTHCGTISSDETWLSSGNVHVVNCDLTVASGVTLTIQPGVIVKFNDYTSLLVQGSLRVLGSGASPVYLTSIKDDAVGGDTNGDGSTAPAPGNWRRIEFQDGSNDANSLIDHAIIRYGGGNDCCNNYGGITLVSASPTIQNTTLTANYHYAIRANLKSFPTLTSNVYSNNGINGLAVQGGTINSNTTWNMTSTAYFIIDDVSVENGATLTVNPGVVVKFEDYRSLLVQGSLRVLGTGASPVYFTSKKDDAIKGDTNNDGSTAPSAGDWMRIEFQDGSNDANSLIDHAVIRYGGDNSINNLYGGITLISASPTIQNSTITQNYYYAIRADLNSFPVLTSNAYTNNGINGLALQGGTISSNTTWNMTNTAYFIIDDISIQNGSTLTVNPGVVVKFEDYRSLLVQGTFRVLGSSVNPVYFTSKKDDAVKGDTNNDGSTTPSAGDWMRIEFQDGSNDANSLIDHAVIRYGGDNSINNLYGGITLISASPAIQNSTITQNYYYAIRADLNSFPVLTSNTYTNNGINGLALQGGTISSNTIWKMTNTAYFIIDDVSVENGITLTINPGVVVKFNDGKSLLIQGALRVLGNSASPVYLTSKKDDAVRGDTNNDGATAPSSANWARIEFQDGSNDATSLIDHAIIRYGGSCCFYNYGGITIDNASPTIRNSTITKNYYGIYTSNSTPTLGCNNIISNDSYGLYNATPATTVVAKYQWWGSANGPYHPTTNSGGTGNAVSDGVNFKPFRNSACTPPAHTLTASSEASNDGWVLESSEASNVGGSFNNIAATISIGDNAAKKQYRGILSFSTGASLPDTAVITGVTLKVKQQGIVGGGNPVTAFQGFMVDIKNGFFGTATLQAGDFQATASNSYGPFRTALTSGWYSINLTSAKAYINKLSSASGLTQIRLRLKLDDNNNTVANYLSLYSGNAAAANRPQLIITYYIP